MMQVHRDVYIGEYMRIMDTSPNEEAKLPRVNAANDVVLCYWLSVYQDGGTLSRCGLLGFKGSPTGPLNARTAEMPR